jgi:ABC-type dipeptide/oligopeptide/nickel transport system ATPase component
MAAWQQGQHVSVIGRTGSGKSYLCAKLLQTRRAVLAIQTKPDDIRYEGFERIKSIGGVHYGQYRYLLSPKPDFGVQAAEIARALDYAWKTSKRDGGWCVYIDELYYLTEKLHLGNRVELMATQGRSKNLSLVIGMQRPVGITRWALSESTHVLSAQLEGRDVKTLMEGTTPRMELVSQLYRYEFAYYFRPTGVVAITEAHRLRQVIPNAA